MLVRKRRVLGYMAVLLIVALLPLNNGSPANHALAVEDALEILLPPPVLDGEVSLEQALTLRRSTRSFADTPLAFDDVAQLLWAAQGITHDSRGFRTAPSAGALFPLEIYFASEEGTYHYLPQNHEVDQMSTEDRRPDICNAAMGMPWVGQAALDIVIAGISEKVMVVYGEKASRLVDVESGHIAQNLHLQAAALGLGSVPIGAFNRKQVQEILGLPKEHRPLYIVCVGGLQP